MQHIKLTNSVNDKEAYEAAKSIFGEECSINPVLEAISSEKLKEDEMASLMPWSEENRAKLKVLNM